LAGSTANIAASAAAPQPQTPNLERPASDFPQPLQSTRESYLTPQSQASIKANVSADSIERAYNRIKCNIVQTPVYKSETYTSMCGCEVFVMLENIQNTGSFKVSENTFSSLFYFFIFFSF
jgi:hypothetical protein